MMRNKCWVVKIGSALLTNNGVGIDKALIARWAEQIVELRAQKIDVILVSSGSIVEGMKRLGWSTKPNDVHKLQAAAAVGQMGLIQAYESLFAIHDVHTAQILLTRENLMPSVIFNDESNEAIAKDLLDLNFIPLLDYIEDKQFSYNEEHYPNAIILETELSPLLNLLNKN